MRKTSLKDIARATDLSISTVSAALRGTGPGLGLAEATITQVRAVSQKLNYIPQASGRALVRGRQNVLLAVLPSDIRAAPWISEYVWGAAAGAARAGYGIQITVIDPDSQSFKDLTQTALGGVDGVAFYYGGGRDPETCEAAGLPAVGLARAKAPNTVTMETEPGVQELWARLQRRNTTELHLWGPPGWKTRTGRAFVKDVIRRSPVPIIETEVETDPTVAIERMLAAGKSAALFSLQDDWIWQLAIAQARRRGGSGVNFDQLPWTVISYESTSHSHRTLARLGVGRLDVETRLMGESAMELLAQRLKNDGRSVPGVAVHARVEWPR
ncbi:MAG TPA: LacI family DNA-binding transcriptional regulator [Planctomycetota bacterium]|nr:LacI family DNA-binding transcriptional regulator [Planctomycetota bacterium]